MRGLINYLVQMRFDILKEDFKIIGQKLATGPNFPRADFLRPIAAIFNIFRARKRFTDAREFSDYIITCKTHLIARADFKRRNEATESRSDS